MSDPKDGVGRGRKASRQMRIVTTDGAEPEATTKVPCPLCIKGMVSAATAARVKEILRAAGVDVSECPNAP